MSSPTGVMAGLRSRLSSVRFRAAILSMLIVGIALAVALAAVTVLYQSQLQASLDLNLEQQVQDRARLINQGSDPGSLVTVLQEEAFVWIGSPTGVAVATGGAIDPVDNPVPPIIGSTSTLGLLVDETKPDEQEREFMELRIASAATSDGELVVLAGAETETLAEDVRRLFTLFSSMLPLLTLAVGASTWFIAGRVLHPVERMRSEAAAISGANLDSRVPVPQSGDELHQLGDTLNAMLDRIESHDQSLRQFSADASHELKSPVANLRALIDTTNPDASNWPGVRDRLTGETDRLRDLVDNLLFLASHGQGATPAMNAVNLDDLLFDEAELLSATGRVAVDLSAVEPTLVNGSHSDLSRLLRNLVDNAARHAKTRVIVGVKDTSTGAVLFVADDGPGVSVNDRDRIFERFTRLDEARARDKGGAGLGLSIVNQIAKDHRATIEVDDAPAGGARFTVRFPPAPT